MTAEFYKSLVACVKPTNENIRQQAQKAEVTISWES